MKRFDIEKNKLAFKNIISAPAPVGRILNYVYYAGTTGLYHENAYRKTDLRGSVGSAWATEFIIGLGIFELGDAHGDKYKLLLTEKGREIFELLSTMEYEKFDEGTHHNSLRLVKEQMERCSKDLTPTLKRIFIESYPFKILKQFLDENGYVYDDKQVFMDDYFEAVKKLYDTDPRYNRKARTSTGKNRVPSLVQLCEILNMANDDGGRYVFNKKAFKSADGENYEFTPDKIDAAVREASLIAAEAEELAKKYGMDGTVLTEVVVRNSALQKIFKQNLMTTQDGKCVICGLRNQELLIGSHIKPASESDAGEKADYYNGLLLCCNHDKLFDRYLITFSNVNGQIEISKTITESDRAIMGLDENYILPSELLTTERASYLTEHNIEFRNREKSR